MIGRVKKTLAFLVSCTMLTTSTAVYAADTDAVVGKLSMDTSSYTMAPGGIYDFKASVSSSVLKQEDVKVWSSRDGIAKVARVAGTGKYRITGLKAGITYITSEIKGVHASIKVTVESGAKPHGVTSWTTSLIHQSDLSSTVNVTFPEGTNLMGIAALLEKNHVCSASDVLAAAKSTQFDSYSFIASLSNASSRYYKLEGYLFPDTYNFYKGDSAANALKRMLNNMQNKLTSIQTQAAAQGMTVDQVLTMASLIQAEASSTSDMYLVSSVLHNRLTNGAAHDTPKLQFDSTVYYPYRVKSEAPAGFTSTYDTYNFSGLPAGPICSPGASAIDAALHPTSTDYYYFCHSASGTAYYAATLDEHNQNLIIAGLR
ncbi:endolytic transglycosylase MltG [Faecalispora anaeroviscerum]|uniref:endolytic transglycosylase MltG n=1 Tax=Faecalispora anaeroviscerum TaxID=2991836 RepID=UPI0024BAC7ED|nr:endolytic transglycosylase MltG [Faecalispora anaeroviscerum]